MTRENLPPLEMWVDDAPKIVKEPSFWNALAEIGVETAAIMVDSTALGFDLIYTVRDLERMAAFARSADIGLVATCWPEPHRARIDDSIACLDEILSLGFVGIENDVEGQWTSGHVQGFSSLAEAAVYLVGKQRELCIRHDLRLEATTHTGHLEAGPHASLVPLVDRVNYQLYSTYHDWRGREVAFGGPGGPGRMQRAALGRIRQHVPGIAGGAVKLGAGLAFYGQNWPGYMSDESLNLALDAAIELAGAATPVAVRGWSSKWVVGAKSVSTAQIQVRSWIDRTWGPR